jgi:hypothetical protein
MVGTTNYKWPGINAKWKSGWKAQYKNQLAWFESFYPQIKAALEHYASTGKTLRQKTGVDTSQYRQWESYLSSTLHTYALLKIFELESKAVREQVFGYQSAFSAYQATRLAHMIDLNVHIRSPRRLGFQLSSMEIHLLPFAALGVIVGDESALPLMRMLIAAYRKGWYVRDDRYPIYTFILLLMADFLGESMPTETTVLLGSSPLAPLFGQWTCPQPADIVPLCLAACDFHTTRCDYHKDMEFSLEFWRYTPVEIMLLMRLRRLRGLENPEFEHPLWTSAFSGVQTGVPVLPDELIQRIEQRMRADGYDEKFIIQGVLDA